MEKWKTLSKQRAIFFQKKNQKNMGGLIHRPLVLPLAAARHQLSEACGSGIRNGTNGPFFLVTKGPSAKNNLGGVPWYIFFTCAEDFIFAIHATKKATFAGGATHLSRDTVSAAMCDEPTLLHGVRQACPCSAPATPTAPGPPHEPSERI